MLKDETQNNLGILTQLILNGLSTPAPIGVNLISGGEVFRGNSVDCLSSISKGFLWIDLFICICMYVRSCMHVYMPAYTSMWVYPYSLYVHIPVYISIYP